MVNRAIENIQLKRPDGVIFQNDLFLNKHISCDLIQFETGLDIYHLCLEISKRSCGFIFLQLFTSTFATDLHFVFGNTHETHSRLTHWNNFVFGRQGGHLPNPDPHMNTANY